MTLVAYFHRVMGHPAPKTVPLRPDEDDARLRMRLIGEEYHEVLEAMTNLLRAREPAETLERYGELLKELADLRYVVEGTAVSLGLPIDEAFAAVHRSNMSKLTDGKPVRDAGGKVIKGPNYEPPDMLALLPTILEHEA